MKPITALIVPVMAVATLGLAGCGSSTADSNGSAPIVHSSTDGDLTKLTMYVFRGAENVLGPDKAGHDATVPASWVVKKGQTMTLTIINEDEGPHTLTAPGIGVNIMIKAGVANADNSITPMTTTATITADKAGVFRWYCLTPCDAGHGGWAMTSDWDGPGRDGFMAGNIVVV